MDAKHFAMLMALMIVGLIIELIRRQKMTFKYSLFWLTGSIFTLIITVHDQIIIQMAALSGFKLASNFVFFIFGVFFGTLGLFLTVYINEQNSRTEDLAQSLGILDLRVKEMSKRLSNSEKS